jgi:FkbM family methyltransferase
VINKLKTFLVRSYHYAKYPEARELGKKGIPFDHYRELNRQWLVASNIKTVLDVGANKGQFAKLARAVFADATIYSFEPLPDCYDVLKNAMPDDKKFFCYNKAAGSSESTLEFFRSVHSPSSSFLQMEDLHKQAFPESSKGQVQQPIQVPVTTLDIFYNEVKPAQNILLKIDVQGFEAEVIKGASAMMQQVKVVILEMSLQKLYKAQPLFHDVYMMMYEKGFRYHGNLSQMLHAETGEVVQLDAVFIKEN